MGGGASLPPPQVFSFGKMPVSLRVNINHFLLHVFGLEEQMGLIHADCQLNGFSFSNFLIVPQVKEEF